MNSSRGRSWIAFNILLSLLLVLTALTSGCRGQIQDASERAGFAVQNPLDCLPNIKLFDQDGRIVSLSSLKGTPSLFDFIYTSCPGPCLLLTARMARIARKLGPTLGNKVLLVSVTVDPEHDKPGELLAYANEQGANIPGWLFLTGTPGQIDDVMARFRLVRQREADGTVDHVLEFFLVGADGGELLQYKGNTADPDQVASDLERVAAGKTVMESHYSIMPAIF